MRSEAVQRRPGEKCPTFSFFFPLTVWLQRRSISNLLRFYSVKMFLIKTPCGHRCEQERNRGNNRPMPERLLPVYRAARNSVPASGYRNGNSRGPARDGSLAAADIAAAVPRSRRHGIVSLIFFIPPSRLCDGCFHVGMIHCTIHRCLLQSILIHHLKLKVMDLNCRG